MDSPDDVFANGAGLWGYATEWLSYRERTDDQTRSRWPVSPQWEAITNVSLRDRPVSVERTSASRQAADERRITAALCGYMASFAALRYIDSLGESLSTAESVLRQWELDTGIPFTDRIAKKRREWEWGL